MDPLPPLPENRRSAQRPRLVPFRPSGKQSVRLFLERLSAPIISRSQSPPSLAKQAPLLAPNKSTPPPSRRLDPPPPSNGPVHHRRDLPALLEDLPPLPATSCPYLSSTFAALNSPACIVAPSRPKSLSPIPSPRSNSLKCSRSSTRSGRSAPRCSCPPRLQLTSTSSSPLQILSSKKTFRSSPPSSAPQRSISLQLRQISPSPPHPSSALSRSSSPSLHRCAKKRSHASKKEKEKLTEKLSRTEAQLANTEFRSKAPPQLIENLEKTKAEASASLAATLEKLSQLLK